MRKGLITALAALLLSQGLKAQQWTEVSTFEGVIWDLKVYDDELFIGGNFTERDNNDCYWTSRLYGSTFFDSPLLSGGGFNEFAIFDGDIYAVGSMQFGSSLGAARWDVGYEQWQVGAGVSESHSGIFADNAELVLGSDFGKVRVRTASTGFTLLPVLDDAVSAITRYQGDIIVGGRFDFAGTTALNRIARWDGTDWQPLAGGLTSGRVIALEVYDGELYAAGDFKKADGADILGIAKWDGTSWSSVGGSVTSTLPNGIRDMMVYNDELYVVGDFTEIGGVAAKYVAKWNGTSWQSLGISQATSFVSTISVYDNKIFVGTFDFNESILYSYNLSGTTSIASVGSATNWSVFPNPTSNVLSINAPQGFGVDVLVEIKDITGKVINTEPVSNAVSINVSNFGQGLYFVSIRNANTLEVIDTKRFVKQ